MSAFASLTTVTRIAGPALPGISFAARLPAAICPIATLLMLTELDSIGTAGIAAGMLWTGQAVGGPFLGRLADRRGHRPVILAASLANTAAIALFVASALTAMPLVVQAALAAVAGLTVPQIGPLSRTRWIVLTDPKNADNPSHTRELPPPGALLRHDRRRTRPHGRTGARLGDGRPDPPGGRTRPRRAGHGRLRHALRPPPHRARGHPGPGLGPRTAAAPRPAGPLRHGAVSAPSRPR